MPDDPFAPAGETTLDPHDWEALRELGHRMVDEMLEYQRSVRERPVWQPVPSEVKAQLQQPLPHDGVGEDAAYEAFRELVLPYPMGNIHPRFWGWVIGTGSPYGMLAEMLAAGMNPNVGGGEHGAAHVEMQVLDWCKEMLGYPREASGLLVSGGSMANLVALTAARNARAGFDVREDGVGAAPRELRVYASAEVHSSVQKAVELLGLGKRALRLVPVDDDFRIDVAALERAVEEDREDGRRPLCVVGCAGTVNTGAVDDLDALAGVCERHGLWFHVDGAFGALAALVPELEGKLRGMERADSVAFDLHKWMYMPYEAGCVLVRDEEEHRHAFSLTPDYLVHAERGIASGGAWFSDYGVQLSRGFRALKIWLTLSAYGADRFTALIRQNVAQARYLADLVEADERLELLAPVELNIVCFRFLGAADEEARDALNREIVAELHERGIAVPSVTKIRGHAALRVAITNHRSRREDFEELVRAVKRLGAELEPARHGGRLPTG